MLRRIIRIDESRCNGCGRCASACHEGAIAMIDGKVKFERYGRDRKRVSVYAVEQ